MRIRNPYNNPSTINRYWKTRNPKSYLTPDHPLLAGSKIIPIAELPLEFMLNALRLSDGISVEYFETRTGLPYSTLLPKLMKAESEGLLLLTEKTITPTNLGKRFLNDLLLLFH